MQEIRLHHAGVGKRCNTHDKQLSNRLMARADLPLSSGATVWQLPATWGELWAKVKSTIRLATNFIDFKQQLYRLNSIRLQKQINSRQIKIYLGTIFRSLHKASNPGTFLHKKCEWIQIFLLHLDFFIALQYLRYTTHNGSQLCFKYHSIQHKSQRHPLDDVLFDECIAVTRTHSKDSR